MNEIVSEETEILKEIVGKIPIIIYPDDETKIHEKCMYYYTKSKISR